MRLHKKRKLDLQLNCHELGRKLGGFGIASPILDRIVENCENSDWKHPRDEKTARMLARRAERLGEVECWLHSLADSIGWRRMQELDEALLSLHDISERSGYTSYGHQLRTMKYARIILEELGFGELGRQREMSAIMLGALFHDVGKAAVRHWLLSKDVLNEEEKGRVKTHAYRGKKILEALLGDGSEEGKVMMTVAHCHHKNADGSGYPARARDCYSSKEYLIIGFADTFDAMTSLRVYMDHKTIKKTLEKMGELFGLQFGRRIGEVFANAAAKEQRLGEIAEIVMEGDGKPF